MSKWLARGLIALAVLAVVGASFLLNEDREAVLAQLAALHALNDRHLGIYFIPGHDWQVVTVHTIAGTLQPGFR
jgi:hypothetical protein